MSATNNLEFRRLSDSEMELAQTIAAVVATATAPECEAWGLLPDGRPIVAGEAWGLFMTGTLSGVVWLKNQGDGAVEATAMALPKGRWGNGLAAWMLERAAAETAAATLRVTLDRGGPGLAEALTDAGFTGPDAEEEGYPAGAWVKLKPT